MATRTIPCETTPRIEIVTNDHLSLSGWDLPSIQIDIASERDLLVNQKPEGVYIEAEDDCMINMPLDASVSIVNASGSASITGLNGELTIDNVGGHLTVNQINNLVCENVGGNLRFSGVRGNISAGNVGGSAKGEGVQGIFSARNVGGSVKINDLNGLEKISAGGNVRARLLTLSGDMKIAAGGAIRLWTPQDVGYELEATSGGEKIVLVTKGERSRYSTGHQRMTVAGGGPLVQLTAGGSITVVDSSFDEESFGEDFGFGNIEVDTSGLDDLSERINARIRIKVDNAEKRFHEAERRAERKASMASARAERTLQRTMEKINIGFKESPARYTPASSQPQAAEPITKASDEERLMILNMLKEGKISPEEASRLLDVLDGKFN